jgi:hypothetical protein
MIKTICRVFLGVWIGFSLPIHAAQLGYSLSWEGTGGYSVEGMFSFDDTLVGAVVDETELSTFTSEAFDPSGVSLGINQLSNLGTFFSFNFDIASQTILQSGWPFGDTGLAIGGLSSPWILVAISGCSGIGVALVAGPECTTDLDESAAGAILASPMSTVPVPAAAWLFGSALLGLGAIKRKGSDKLTSVKSEMLASSFR